MGEAQSDADVAEVAESTGESEQGIDSNISESDGELEDGVMLEAARAPWYGIVEQSASDRTVINRVSTGGLQGRLQLDGFKMTCKEPGHGKCVCFAHWLLM